MKQTWDEDWIDEEDLLDEQSHRNYFDQQRILRSLTDIDEDVLEEDSLEVESAQEFWFTRGVDQASVENLDGDD